MPVQINISESTIQAAIIEGVRLAIAPMLPRVAEGLIAAMPVQEPKETAAPGAKRILQEKGYRVKSHRSLMKILTENGVTGRKRGGEWWFPVQDIKLIDSKR